MWDFAGGSDGKASVYYVGDLVRSLGWEDPLEKEMGAERVKLWPGAEWALYGDTGPGTLGRAPGCVEK